MKATPEMQARLLDLQELDTTLHQLDHRTRSLPELIDIANVEKELPELENQVVRASTALSDVQREVTKAEADVQLVRDRAERDRKRLEAGVGSAKDLQGLQHELESLARRQSVLEDEELAVMERAEAAEAELRTATAARDELAARLDELRTAADEKLAQIRSERERAADARPAMAASVPPDLLALYDRIAAHSVTGAAPLVQRRCGGCRLDLNVVDLARIRAAAEDEVLRCEECGRILVRTEESGL